MAHRKLLVEKMNGTDYLVPGEETREGYDQGRLHFQHHNSIHGLTRIERYIETIRSND